MLPKRYILLLICALPCANHLGLSSQDLEEYADSVEYYQAQHCKAAEADSKMVYKAGSDRNHGLHDRDDLCIRFAV